MQGGPEAEYRHHLAEGRFMIQRAKDSGAYVHYPRTAEPASGARDLEWVAAAGTGTVHATSVVRQRPEQGGDFNISLIDLDEGPRFYSRVVNIAPDAVFIGQRVTAHVGMLDGKPAVLFSPLEVSP